MEHTFSCLARKFLHNLAIAGWLTVNALAPAAAQEPDNILELNLSGETPVERGLSFDRFCTRPAKVNISGKEETAWQAYQGSFPDKGWLRAFRFKVTDPRFQNGKMPVADVEITYCLPANATTNLWADTGSGARLISTYYGNVKEWRTITVPLVDAYFGARPVADGEESRLSGFDLMLSGGNTDLFVKQVRVIGHDIDDPAHINWQRVLGLGALKTSGPADLFLFTQSAGNHFSVEVKNFSRVPRPLKYTVSVSDYRDKIWLAADGQLELKGQSAETVSAAFDAANWPLGPYEATLNFYLDEKTAKPVMTKTISLGIISGETIGKARRGEFLYGLDPANYSYPPLAPEAFAYYRLMGVDILRMGVRPLTLETVTRTLAQLAPEGVLWMPMVDPPRASTPEARARDLVALKDFLQAAARQYSGYGPDKICYWELGNEPDLPMFYPFEIDDYIASYHAMYDAIKAGAGEKNAADADTVVMNGGLSFAGQVGPARSREFIEKVSDEKVDVLAYHGHGFGIAAERDAYERALRVMAGAGKKISGLAETESGFLGLERSGVMNQAITVVQKMTYAQSVKIPLFIFFRLYMKEGFEGGYGMTELCQMPRPSVLSYRNMVAQLRHHVFVKTLNFSGRAASPDLNGFVFAEVSVSGERTGRKVAVLFSESRRDHEQLIQLDRPGAKVDGVTVVDLFGNSKPVQPTAANTLAVTVSKSPQYIVWRSAGDAELAEVVKPPLTLSDSEPLLTDTANPLTLTVHNPVDTELTATLIAESASLLVTSVAPAAQQLTVPAGQPLPVTLTVSVAKADRPLRLPRWWKVFLDANLTDAPLTVIPDTLTVSGGESSGEYVWTPERCVDFAKLAGGFAQQRPAVAYAVLYSPQDAVIDCAASGDWWWALFVNGEKIYDRMSEGNGHGEPLRHRFKLPLKQGRNVLAVQVRSGSGGWRFEYGGPNAATPDAAPHQLALTLSAGGATLGRQTMPFQIQEPVPPLAGVTVSANALEQWLALEPLTVMDAAAVRNFWLKEPDQTRWHTGPKDLSATVWLRDDGQRLLLQAAVTDDQLAQSPDAEHLDQHDSLRVVFADLSGSVLFDTRGGLVNNQPVSVSANPQAVFSATRDEQRRVTLYHWSIPKTVVGARPFRLNLSVADNDRDYLKQTADLGDVTAPSRGLKLKCEP